MEKPDFLKVKQRFVKSSRKQSEQGNWLLATAEKLNKPIGQVGKLLEGWDAAGIKSLYLSAESYAKEKGIPFSQSWWWHFGKIKEELANNLSTSG